MNDTSNKRLVVVLGQCDFAGNLAERINASQAADEQPAIAISIVSQNDGRLNQVERYFAAHPQSSITILHGRAYSDLAHTAGELKRLGQKVILVIAQQHKETLAKIKADVDRLGVDGFVLETRKDMLRGIRALVSNLLNPNAHSKPVIAEGCLEESVRRDEPAIERSLLPVKKAVRSNPVSRFKPALVTHQRDSNPVVLPTVQSVQPISSLTIRRRLAMVPIPGSTISPAIQEAESDSPIDAVFAKLGAVITQSQNEIAQRVETIRQAVAWLAQLEATSMELRQEAETYLVENFPETLRRNSPHKKWPDSQVSPSPAPVAAPAESSSHRHHNGAKRFSVGRQEISLHGGNAIKLFEVLTASTGAGHTRDALQAEFGAKSPQSVYQVVHELRRQLRKQLGNEVADRCFSNGPPYRWDASALSVAT